MISFEDLCMARIRLAKDIQGLGGVRLAGPVWAAGLIGFASSASLYSA